MAISHQRVPPGGWRFLEPKSQVTIVAITWSDLVNAVTKHRRSNGIDVGEPEKDIDLQLEEKNPQLSINGHH